MPCLTAGSTELGVCVSWMDRVMTRFEPAASRLGSAEPPYLKTAWHLHAPAKSAINTRELPFFTNIIEPVDGMADSVFWLTITHRALAEVDPSCWNSRAEVSAVAPTWFVMLRLVYVPVTHWMKFPLPRCCSKARTGLLSPKLVWWQTLSVSSKNFLYSITVILAIMKVEMYQVITQLSLGYMKLFFTCSQKIDTRWYLNTMPDW